jgi:hypothetical protein
MGLEGNHAHVQGAVTETLVLSGRYHLCLILFLYSAGK